MAKTVVKQRVQPKAIWIQAAVSNVAAGLTNPQEVVITAGVDGVHSINSRHYGNEALDVRSKNFPTRESKEAFMRDVRQELGASYLVILESEGTDNEHFHIQFRR